ncbi:circularly permuted type 2 ATP-grasp protein [Gemmatimonas sp.]|uniref:circularly permuted type 2 ATP-grasp protein n=1 Tax=Gemmatimonas sp. TaxID=1962908 RepID=UPI003982DE4E
MSTSAIARYHDTLQDRGLAEASAEVLDRQLRHDGLFFGERPLCSVLRPRFLSLAQYRQLARACALVGAAFEKVRVAAMANAALRSQFGLTAWEEQLIHADPGFDVASPTSRLDAFFAEGGGGLKFTEYNAETPAGAAYNDALSRAFLSLPVMHEFGRTHIAMPLPATPSVVHSLLNAFYSWRGVREAPTIVILDWKEVPTYSEFVLFEREFTALGIDAFIGDPRDAEYANGKLMIGGKHVTMIYKRVLIDELVTREGLGSPVIQAVREGAVCMVNPFRCKMLHKKASLAVLSDERQAALLTHDEQAAVAAHVPWTRVVEARHTQYGASQVDLLEFTAANRATLVLKPNDEYGGKGIVLGWTVNDAEWESAIRTALAEPYIVQERVEVPSELWPEWTDGALHLGERMLDTAPFLADGVTMSGCLTRIATDPLLNVTAGGGSNVPTFLVEQR